MKLTLRGLGRASVLVSGWTSISAAMLIAQYYLRGAADNLGRPTYSARPVEEWLFGRSPVFALQHVIPGAPEIVWPVVAVYMSWFLVPLLLQGLVLARAGPRALVTLLLLHATVMFTADIAYALFPTRPPWVDLGVTRVVATALGHPRGVDNNPFASVPSLHVAIPCLYALWLSMREERALKLVAPLVGLWAVGVVFTVVYGAEHYVVGAAAGALWAGGILCGTSVASKVVRQISAGKDAGVTPVRAAVLVSHQAAPSLQLPPGVAGS